MKGNLWEKLKKTWQKNPKTNPLELSSFVPSSRRSQNGESSFWRVCDIYASFLSSRTLLYDPQDPIEKLIQAGLRPILKQAFLEVQIYQEAFIGLLTNDRASLDEERSVFDEVHLVNLSRQEAKKWHPSRFVHLENFRPQALENGIITACRRYEHALELQERIAEHNAKLVISLSNYHMLGLHSMNPFEKQRFFDKMHSQHDADFFVLGADEKILNLSLNDTANTHLLEAAIRDLAFRTHLHFPGLSVDRDQEQLDFSDFFYQELDEISLRFLVPTIEALAQNWGLEVNFHLEPLEERDASIRAKSFASRASGLSLYITSLEKLEQLGASSLSQALRDEIEFFLKKN